MCKKKYHGGLKVLLLLSFTILLGICSTCYALQPTNEINAEFANAFFDKIEENIEKTYYGNYQTTVINSFKNFRQNVNISQFVDDWNNNVSVDNFPYLEQIVFALGSNTATNQIYIVQNNNGIGDVLPNFWLGYHSTQNNYYIYKNFFNNGSTTYTSGKGQRIDWNSNGTYTFNNAYTQSTSYYGMAITQQINILENITYSDNSLCFIPAVFGYKHQFIFISPDISNSKNGNWYWNTNIIDYDFTPPIDPEEPSGDSGLGNITTPSGDSGGNINLQPIQQGINDINNNLNNIENKIPTSGDIQNAVGQATENYWGSSGDLTGDEQEQSISDNLNNMMSDLSGDLSKNEAFVALEEAENGFLDLFKNHSDDPNYYDLAFEWNDFEYQGAILIPAGSINISQMCRDNVQLGYIQGLIRVIFNFEVALTLIFQVWNLILSTLGIDNPYLYEEYNELDRLDPQTGEIHTTLIRRRRHLK